MIRRLSLLSTSSKSTRQAVLSRFFSSDELTKSAETSALVPIDFTTASSIQGQESQIVHVDIEPNQSLLAETGSMLYMTEGVEIETGTAGGIGQGLKRMMTGENFFVSHFSYSGDQKGSVAFGTDFPSKIIQLPLQYFGGAIICQKGAFLCGSSTINIEMEFAKKFGVGFFGGEGFVLQRLTGEGTAFIKASGALIERELKPDETLRVSSGCLVAFEPSVAYDISMMKGFKNVVFGGEGLFVTTLTGPGKVYLQGLPFERVVDQLARRMPGKGGGMFMPIGMPGMGGSGSGGEGEGESAGGEGESDTTSSSSEESVFPEDDNSMFGDSSTTGSATTDADPFVADDPQGGDTWGQDTGTDSSSSSSSEDDEGVVSSVSGFFRDFFKDD